MLSKLADSTRSAFMSGTGVAPFFEGENCLEKQKVRKTTTGIVVFLHHTMGRTAKG